MAASAVTLTRHNGVALIEINHKPVNALSKSVRLGLLNALATIADEAGLSAVVLYGGEGRFIAGADISELAGPLEEPFLPEIVAKVDALDKPIIAAIDGAALGGGLEIALACDCRIASPQSMFALPEAKLGLIPGAGGTQRLPRLLGIPVAEAFIANAHVLKAARAFEIGLVDVVVDDPLQHALNAAPSTSKRRLSSIDISRPCERPAWPPQSTAVAMATSLVKQTASWSFETGLARERECFLKLRESEQAQARIHLFLASRSAARISGPSEERSISSVFISGSGKRSLSIATLLTNAGFLVTTKSDDLADADLVIDTADDWNARVSLKRLELHAKASAILATTRGRNIDRLADAAGGCANVIGLNFRTSRRNTLVEIAPATAAEPAAIKAVIKLVRKLAMHTVVTREPGLVGKRLSVAARAAADRLRRQGEPDAQIRAALLSLGVLQPAEVQLADLPPVHPAHRQFLLGEMAAAGKVLLAESIVHAPSDIDLIMVRGYNFPDDLGGPLWAVRDTDWTTSFHELGRTLHQERRVTTALTCR